VWSQLESKCRDPLYPAAVFRPRESGKHNSLDRRPPRPGRGKVRSRVPAFHYWQRRDQPQDGLIARVQGTLQTEGTGVQIQARPRDGGSWFFGGWCAANMPRRFGRIGRRGWKWGTRLTFGGGAATEGARGKLERPEMRLARSSTAGDDLEFVQFRGISNDLLPRSNFFAISAKILCNVLLPREAACGNRRDAGARRRFF
jgi:hypothetical protein